MTENNNTPAHLEAVHNVRAIEGPVYRPPAIAAPCAHPLELGELGPGLTVSGEARTCKHCGAEVVQW